MKTELTQEAKARFFAQYWGQEIYKEWSFEDSYKVNGNTSGFLQLKSIQDISNEDALNVCKISRDDVMWGKMNRDELYVFAKHFSEWNIKGVDYLRSNGYALPFMGLSVEQMIEVGWIKLSEKGDKGNG